MGDLINFIASGSMPPYISSVFAAFIILGILFIFLSFIYKGWKTYHEFNMLNRRQEQPEEDTSSKKEDTVDIALKIYEKVVDLTNNYAGKFVTPEDLDRLRIELKKEIKQINDRLKLVENTTTKIKDELGIK
jgi:hypothetical protein